MPVFDYYHVPFQTSKANSEISFVYKKIEMPSAKVHVSAATSHARSVVGVGSALLRPASGNTTPNPSCQTTAYSRLSRQLTSDERLLKELALEKRIGFYRFYGDIGIGNFSQVKLAVHQLTQERVAIKIISKRQLDTKTDRMLMREINNMEKLHHPNIIRLYEVIETPSKIYLAMEHAAGGELFHRITDEGRISEVRARLFMAQLISAVEHMHSMNVIHRDIKAENVFFARPEVVKLGDLGFSTQVCDSEQALMTFCGSPPYAAPELFRDDHYRGASVDIWALGVLLYFMVEGAMPFRAGTVAALKRQILTGSLRPALCASDPCRRLISGLMRHNAADRLTLAEARSSDWLRTQHFPQPWQPLQLHAEGQHSADLQEKTARRRLEGLGVEQELLVSSWRRGCRSPISGIYRIMLHRLMRIEAGELLETGSPIRISSTSTRSSSTPRPPSSTRSTILSATGKPTKSKACAIL